MQDKSLTVWLYEVYLPDKIDSPNLFPNLPRFEQMLEEKIVSKSPHATQLKIGNEYLIFAQHVVPGEISQTFEGEFVKVNLNKVNEAYNLETSDYVQHYDEREFVSIVFLYDPDSNVLFLEHSTSFSPSNLEDYINNQGLLKARLLPIINQEWVESIYRGTSRATKFKFKATPGKIAQHEWAAPDEFQGIYKFFGSRDIECSIIVKFQKPTEGVVESIKNSFESMVGNRNKEAETLQIYAEGLSSPLDLIHGKVTFKEFFQHSEDLTTKLNNRIDCLRRAYNKYHEA